MLQLHQSSMYERGSVLQLQRSRQAGVQELVDNCCYARLLVLEFLCKLSKINDKLMWQAN